MLKLYIQMLLKFHIHVWLQLIMILFFLLFFFLDFFPTCWFWITVILLYWFMNRFYVCKGLLMDQNSMFLITFTFYTFKYCIDPWIQITPCILFRYVAIMNAIFSAQHSTVFTESSLSFSFFFQLWPFPCQHTVM